MKPELYSDQAADTPASAAVAPQPVIVTRDFAVEDAMLKLVWENKIQPSDLPPRLRARPDEPAEPNWKGR